MDERELAELCKANSSLLFQIIPRPYWTAELYSFGKHIREYGHFPRCLPLCIYTDHGAGRVDHPFKHELESDAPCQFYHSPASVAEWKKVSSKPGYVLYSPFVFYKRKNKIEKNPDAKGTIAFPAHTTAAIDDISDIESYIKQLLALPRQFQPVSVCLHMHDINKGRHKLFMKHGLPVFTAGNSHDYQFAERFYDILKRFSFSTSNMIGSYTFYSVEMGIPFSLYGNKQVFINTGDPNVAMGEYEPYKEFQTYRVVHDLFRGLHTTITPEQKNLVETDLGLRDGVSRVKMASILYTSLLKWTFSCSSIRYLSSFMQQGIKWIYVNKIKSESNADK